jgi:dipeptidase D
MKHTMVICLLLAVLLVVACGADPTPVPVPTEPPPGQPNPASQLCVERGYQSEIRMVAGGQAGYCLFPDGSECEEWAYYRGECAPAREAAGMPNPASQLCVDRGYRSEIRDEAGGQAGYCLFPDGSECAEWAFYSGECVPASESLAAPAQLANPASENCVAVGGTWTMENRVGGGQFGICLFEDNRQCEEWALLSGDCPVGGVKVTGYVTAAAVYCAITGGEYATTGNAGAGDEQGTCTFEDGTVCDAWEYYDGKCVPGSAQPAAGSTIEPLIEELCNGQAQAMSHVLDDLVPTVTEERLDDPVTGATGTGCQATITGTGVQFESPWAVVGALGAMLAEQGWTADPMFVADGPTGTAAGYRKGDQICLAAAMWQPDESANCPGDQPISACEVTPEQQNYTVTLSCGVAGAGGQGHKIPLKDALGTLEPQDVFQNFCDITQVPRPSGHMDRIREFLVSFGQELGLETIVDEAGNVIIRKPAAAGLENRQGVILQAHMDMVPDKHDDLDFEFTTDPIQAFVSGDYVVTEGTTLGADDGIGMAMIMAVLQSQTLQAGPLEGLFTVDEETDMSGANGLKNDVLQGSILINLDSEWEGVFLIGAAGGGHVNVSSSYAQVSAPADMVSYQVKIQGLKGGHSGVDINLGRGHGIKLLVRLLKGAVEPYGLHLARLNGGTAGNAIPRQASAVVLLPGEQVEGFTKYVQAFEATVQSELAAVEPDLSVELGAAEPPAQVMDESSQAVLLDALYANPQGVLRMSDALPGLVETSNNLGVVNVQDGQVEVICVPRSSVDSALEDASRMIASVWELAGYQVAFADYYQGWNPDPASPILGLMEATYWDLYGREPEVMAVHAGLECGVIGAKYPEMDMISIGPMLEDVHSPAERLNAASVQNVMDLLLETLRRIPEG